MKSHALSHSAAALLLTISLPFAFATASPQLAFAQEEDVVLNAPAADEQQDTTDDCLDQLVSDEQVATPVLTDETGQEDQTSDDSLSTDEGNEQTDDQEQTDVELPTEDTVGQAASAGEEDLPAPDPADTTPLPDSTQDDTANMYAQVTTLNGVDISGWNPGVDLASLPGDFVIIKATEWNRSANSFTSYNTGLSGNYSSYIDQANAALAAGKRIGFYHFATNPEGGRNSGGKSYIEQAQGFLDAVKDYIGRALLCLDWENAELSDGTVYSVIESDVSGAKAWLDYVYEKTGVKPVIYMNKTCSEKYDWSSVANAGYELWGAQYLLKYYPESGTINGYVEDPELRSGWGAWGAPRIYQYTSKASMTGSGGEIDVDKFYGSANDWDRLIGSSERWMESEGSYYYVGNGHVKTNTWIVTSKSPTGANTGYQRYWVDASGKLAMGRLITAAEAGYNAYARPEGYVVRGMYSVGNTIYLADNDGRMPGAGWVVTNAYGQGLQRYYIDAATLAAVRGFSTAGWDHYTRPEGYVVRGVYTASNGYVYLANNDGLLEAGGWLVSNQYGHGLQRYYIDKDARACIPGYSTKGWTHYTRPEGYVVRGRYAASSESVFIANNDGLLTSGRTLKDGWLVTSDLGQGLQRYWVENGDITFNKLIKVAEGLWTYARPEGYVVRGLYTAPNGFVYLANNDGRLESPGWVVSNAYGQGLQRYYIDANEHGCVPGFSTDGWNHYTTSKGYTLRGAINEHGAMRYANNDGKLVEGWIVTDGFGQGLQRYWQENGVVVKNRLIQVNNSTWTFARPEGYVVRGKYTASNGNVYLANNDGVLERTGWFVSKAYDGDYQRYYIDATLHAAIPGYSTDGWAHYTTPMGYVLRGAKYLKDGSQYEANNEGKLTYVTTAAKGIVNAAKKVGIPASLLDSDWVADVLAEAGLYEARGYDGYAFQIYYNYCDSKDKGNLQAGMLVAVPRSNVNSVKEFYGAVGLALGDGTVMQLDNGKLSTLTIDSWISKYGDERTPRWGWLFNTALVVQS